MLCVVADYASALKSRPLAIIGLWLSRYDSMCETLGETGTENRQGALFLFLFLQVCTEQESNLSPLFGVK